jgi:mannosyltransferase
MADATPVRSLGSSASGDARGALARLRGSSLTLGILVASGAALALGLVRLGTPSLWADESFTARAVNGSVLDLFDGYHGLYYSVAKTWALFAGTSEAALRFPSVVGAMLASALLVVLGYRLFDRRVAIVGGILLAASPFVVQWSQQARGYTLMLALSLGATLLLLRALDRRTRADWGLYGVAFATLVVWHPVAGLLLAPAHIVPLWQRRNRVLPHGLLAGAIVLALGVPWAAQIAIRSTGEGVAMDWLKFPTAGAATHALLDVSGAAGLGVLLAAAGLWVLNRSGKRELAVWLGVWAIAPFLLALLVSLAQPIYLDRYLIVAAPAYALLAGVAIMGVGTRLRAGLIAAVVVATGLGLAQWYSSAGDGNWRGENWRDGIRMVTERSGEADTVVVVPWSAHPAAEYYGARPVDVSSAASIWVLVWSETEPRDIEDAERQGLGFGEHRRVEKLDFGRRLSAQLWVREP